MKNSPSAVLLLFALTSYASDSTAQVSVQKITIQPATGQAIITLENNSPKNVTAYGLSIDNIYGDGHAEHQEEASDMGPALSSFYEEFQWASLEANFAGDRFLHHASGQSDHQSRCESLNGDIPRRHYSNLF
jgi:hypothetical protein